MRRKSPLLPPRYGGIDRRSAGGTGRDRTGPGGEDLAVIDGDNAFPKHAETVRLVFRRNNANGRFRISKRERKEGLTQVSGLPVAGVAIEVLPHVAVAPRHETAIIKVFPLGISE